MLRLHGVVGTVPEPDVSPWLFLSQGTPRLYKQQTYLFVLKRVGYFEEKKKILSLFLTFLVLGKIQNSANSASYGHTE